MELEIGTLLGGGAHTIDVAQTSVEINRGIHVEGFICCLHSSDEDVAVIEADRVRKGGFLEGHGCGGFNMARLRSWNRCTGSLVS